ncbi:MAG TPA: F0F1 ATP synthase subunit epsilon [Egicoccus sp.]|nr:F0F1 ATP synthase subunit epsilon [Egicoccus sp.]HSK24594.1 F0F1 ATP synthase subunit epsilon [Egicoccus sp.]
MRLRVCTPTAIPVDREVVKVVAESSAGSFCMLPRHADVVATLVPGLLSYVADDVETFVAVDGGTLVKVADEVRVSTPQAMTGPGLEGVAAAVREAFRVRTDREREARSALARMEADVLHGALELDERRR